MKTKNKCECICHAEPNTVTPSGCVQMGCEHCFTGYDKPKDILNELNKGSGHDCLADPTNCDNNCYKSPSPKTDIEKSPNYKEDFDDDLWIALKNWEDELITLERFYQIIKTLLNTELEKKDEVIREWKREWDLECHALQSAEDEIRKLKTELARQRKDDAEKWQKIAYDKTCQALDEQGKEVETKLWGIYNGLFSKDKKYLTEAENSVYLEIRDLISELNKPRGE